MHAPAPGAVHVTPDGGHGHGADALKDVGQPPALPELEPPAAMIWFSFMTNLKSSADVPHVVGIVIGGEVLDAAEFVGDHVHEPTTDARPNGLKTPR